ncbi:MAG: CidA/LrgA family protein [Lachnospiraceae bacterium]|nr:CidA/LrgA family protein [Lachnospiraceae bacterium]
MQYIFQLLVILGASFLGEICNLLLPLPIPASVYGLVLLFTALMTGIIKLENVEKAATFLIATMSIYFIAPSVSLMTVIADYVDSLLGIVVICCISTILVMVVTGKVSQLIMEKSKPTEGVVSSDGVNGKEDSRDE